MTPSATTEHAERCGAVHGLGSHETAFTHAPACSAYPGSQLQLAEAPLAVHTVRCGSWHGFGAQGPAA